MIGTWSRHKGIGSDRSFKLLTKSLCLLSYWHQKRKTKATKAKISYKSNLKKAYWSMMIMHIILDLIGNDLQNQFMTYLWFGIKMEHLPVWNFIHLCAVFLYSIGPNVSSNAPLEMKCKCLNLIIGCEKFYLYAFIHPSSHYFWKKLWVVLINLRVWFLYQSMFTF